MSNTIVICSQYKSVRVLLQLWIETLLPTYQVIEADYMAQVVELVKDYAPKAVIFEGDHFTQADREAVTAIKTKASTQPVVFFIGNDLNGKIEQTPEIDHYLTLNSFRERIKPLLLALSQIESAVSG